MPLVESYMSQKTNVAIKSIGSVDKDNINPDLIELADSGLIDKNILNFGEGSFVFESENIILPNMIYPNIVKYISLLGVGLQSSLLTNQKRKELLVKLSERLKSQEAVAEMAILLNIDEIVQKLKKQQKDSLAETVFEFFNGSFLNRFHLSIDGYEASDKDELFFKISLEPKLKTEEVLSDYIQAVIYESKLYRRAVGSEKMAFCPVESRLGSQMQWLTCTLINKIEALNTYVINAFIQLLESEFEQTIDEYVLETNKVSGIDIENSLVYYFQNISCPNGTAAILSGSFDDEKIFLAYLKEPTKFIPYLLNVTESAYIDKFEEIHELNKIGSVI